jgi:hypothetical protein
MAAPATEKEELSPSLQAWKEKPPLEQAAFWKSCVARQQAELAEIGGLPIDNVCNDVMTRYFDSSECGMSIVYNCALRHKHETSSDGLLNKHGLYIALSEHYCFFDVLEGAEKERVLKENSNERFERVCEAIGLPCGKESLGYAVRRLRIAVLLHHFLLHEEHSQGHRREHSRRALHEEHSPRANEARTQGHRGPHGRLYHIDYAEDNIYSPFNKSVKQKQVKRAKREFNIPMVEPQIPEDDLQEYLYVTKESRKGKVHWAHLQCPSTEMLVAFGQVWRMNGPDLTLFCEMVTAQPQIQIARKSAGTDTKGYGWSSLVMPGIFLDPLSRESLVLYREWFEISQHPRHKYRVSESPPRIRVGVTTMNLGMLWSSAKAQTLLSVGSEAHYIGKWNTDVKEHMAKTKGFFRNILNYITCRGCCTKRKSSRADSANDPDDPDEGTPLVKKDYDPEADASEHKEAGIEISAQLMRILEDDSGGERVAHSMGATRMGEKALDPTESSISFESVFAKILQSLERPNSMLRLGNHLQLLVRIMSNRTAEYLDVLDVYQAAIARLSHLLHDDDTNNKDDLVAKIGVAKLELSALERHVTPFSDFVVNELYSAVEQERDSNEYPLVFHHMKDVQNNIRTFLPKCSALITCCTSLTDEYDRISGDKMNHLLNILTFITFVITPMQLMTGVYGMNWTVFPELQWHHGYLFFWCLSLTLSCAFALILTCLKRS